MKKIISLFLVLAMCLSFMSVTALAGDPPTQDDYNSFGPTGDLPYMVEFHWNGAGSVTVDSQYDQLVFENKAKVRVANTVTSLTFELHPGEGERIDGIRVEQDGVPETNPYGFVDLDNDARYASAAATFTVDLSGTKYDDPEVSGNKFVNINFDFTDGQPQGPVENQYCLRYSDAGSVSGIDSEAVQSFTANQAITWSLTYPTGAEKLYCVEINEFGDPGNHFEYRDGDTEHNSSRITVDNTGRTVSFTPGSVNAFEVIIHWTEQDFFDSFGCNRDEEIQLQCRVLNGHVYGTGIDAPMCSIHDDESGWDSVKINVPKDTQSFAITFANNENCEFEKAVFADAQDTELPVMAIKGITYTWSAADFNKGLDVYFKDTAAPGPVGGTDIEVIFRGCKSVSENVVTYTVGETDVAVTVDGATVQNADDRYKVLVPRDNMSSVTFTVGSGFDTETMQVALHGDQNFGTVLELTNSATSLAAHDGGLPDWVNFEIEAKGGPAPGPGGEDVPWYTVSWAGGNVTVENGQVLAERVHVAATTTSPAITYTAIEDEVDEDNNIFDLWETIGKQKENDEDPDALQLYGLGFSQSDLFIQSGLGGVSIDYKFVPAYGYQLKNIYTNEDQQESFLNAFTTDDNNISAFTFDVTEVDQNVHFCVYFEKVDDTAVTDDAANVSEASIANGGNAVSSGNLLLTVADKATDTTVENAVSTFDVTLDNIVSKGGENGNWTTNITEFEDPVTVALTLDKTVFKADDYSVVREHGGAKEELDAAYDPQTGVLSFETNKFSSYTIVAIDNGTPEPSYDPEPEDEEEPAVAEKEEPLPFTDVTEGEDYFYDAVKWAVENNITSGTDATHFSPELNCTRAQMMMLLWRAAGSPEPTANTKGFNDVNADSYYYKAVLWAAENGISGGTGGGNFSPARLVTRAQAVMFLYNFNGNDKVSAENVFTDVSSDAYYYDAVLWAAENAVTAGTSDTTFSPDEVCDRGQVVTFLFNNFVK